MDAYSVDPTFVLAPGTSREYLLHNGVCPAGILASGELYVLTSERAHTGALQELSFLYGRPLQVAEAPHGDFDRAVEHVVTRSERERELITVHGGEQSAAEVTSLANEPPVIRYVNLVIQDAAELGASDVHLEATATGLRVRLRRDGVLTQAPEPPADLHRAVVSRIKLMADLNIAERRAPQDGRIRIGAAGRDLDIRVSTVPTVFGESVVLRLLNQTEGPARLQDLGMPAGVLQALMELLGRSHGLLLVTGPTGSGKTTTLYAALRTRDSAQEKLMTVEDPVEYQLAGVTQVPVHRQGGVTFASALRSLLRQDPDVILIGEMRDRETAEIGIQAAMTGHLVLATLHTNDAIGAIPRLIDLGIPPYLVAATVDMVVAQRLVRTVCPECTSPSVARTDHGLPASRVRCPVCRDTGYRGRVGIFESIAVTDPIRQAITRGASGADLKQLWLEEGGAPLGQDGERKAATGVTTYEEVMRVTARQ